LGRKDEGEEDGLALFRHFERIADQATNIAEDVIYMPRVSSSAIAQRTILATINVCTLGVDFSLKNEYYPRIAGRRAMSVSVERVVL
jgi:hypothetical protein